MKQINCAAEFLKLHPDVYLYEMMEVVSFTPRVAQICLRPMKEILSYEAGQYVNVLHEDLVSPLSIACAPRVDHVLEFHLFHAAWNQKANHLLHLAQEERAWRLSGPFGAITVGRLKRDKPLIFLARGTSFAPIKAILEALFVLQPAPPLYFYWCAQRREDFYLVNLLQEWQERVPTFHFTLLTDTESHTSKETASHTILREHPDLSDYQVCTGGSHLFVQTAFRTFMERGGLKRENFYSDMM